MPKKSKWFKAYENANGGDLRTFGQLWSLVGRELLEKEIELQCGFYLKSLGHFFWKVTSNGYFDARIKRFRKQASPFARNGCPDFLLIYKGVTVGLEFKTKRGQQTDDQKAFERDLIKAGGYYFVVRSLEELKAYLQILKGQLG